MKLFLFLFLLSTSAFASPWPIRITSLSTSFPAAPQLFSVPNQLQVIQIANNTTSELEVDCSSYSAAYTPTTGVNTFYIPANTGFQNPVPAPLPMGRVCFFRAVSSVVSSGYIDVVGWGF